MKYIFSLLTFAIFLFGTKASAQTPYENGENGEYVAVEEIVPDEIISVEITQEITPAEAAPVIYRYIYINPLDRMFQRDPVTGILRLPDNRLSMEPIHGLSFRDTVFVNPLFLPVVFQGRILPRDLSFFPIEDTSDRGILIPQRVTLAPQLARVDFAQNVRRQFYIDHPSLIRFTEADLPEPPAVSDDEVLHSLNPFRGLFRTESTIELVAPTVTGAVIGRRYWERSGEHSLQFAQFFFSENWGGRRGVSHTSIDTHHTVRANFKRDNILFENALEWRLTLNTTSTDTLRNHVINRDLINYRGRFGIEAFRGREGWTYSTNVNVQTGLFNHYRPNLDELQAAFLSPLIVTTGIGLSYTIDRRSERVRHRRIRIRDTSFDPISIRYVFVNNPDVDVRQSSINIPEGRRQQLIPGTNASFNMTFDFNRFVTWTTRFNYFTNYSSILTEFDNRLHMQLTNALATTIELNLRYDDSVSAYDREGNRYQFGLLQVNQSLRVGLRYTW